MNRRRLLITSLGAVLTGPRVSVAQQAARLPRIGALMHGQPATPEQIASSPLRQGLKELGWIPGQNVIIDALYSEGNADRLVGLAEEFVRRRVDVIWCNGPPSAVAAARATQTIPIVFWGVGLPTELGLIRSFARPGGNVTGIAHSAGGELAAKVLEVLQAIAPTARRIARLHGVSSATTVSGEPMQNPALEPAFRQFSMQARIFTLETGEDLSQIFASILEWRADALYVFGDPATWNDRHRIVQFANRQKLPIASAMRDFALAGALFSYGADVPDTVRKSATYLDRILKGARPSDIPVEQPSVFQLVINARTARDLGLQIPASVLARADEVIR